jgi:hypothetical protein
MTMEMSPSITSIVIGAIQLLTAVILGFTLRSARLQNKVSRKRFGIEAVFSLKNEYSGISYFVYQLHDFFEFCKSHDGEVVTEYNRAVQEEQKTGKNNLQMSRQIVSHFYQKLAAYYSEGLVSKDTLFPIWPWRDLELLDDLIIPIEESTEGHSKTAVDDLKRLYKDSLRFRDSV